MPGSVHFFHFSFSRYFVDLGRSGFHRSDIEKALKSNAFLKQLEKYHPAQTKDPSHLTLKVIRAPSV